MRKEKIIDKALKSRTAKASRRIFFTYCEETIKERGYYWADFLHNFGSCILIKYENRFFALTAKHVLTKNLIEFGTPTEEYQNESPFFICSKSTAWSQKDASSVLYPALYWDIGCLIDDHDSMINYKDVALIEMFPHSIKWKPDKFLDLDNIIKFWPISDFFEGQALFASGYPKNKNDYEYTPYKGFTHSTTINRHIIPGICTIKDGEPVIDLSHTDISEEEKSHDSLWGMSGGMVFNVMETAEEPYWCGMIVSGSGGLIRFIPTEVILNAIANYRDAPSAPLDPRGTIKVEEDYRAFLMDKSYN